MIADSSSVIIRRRVAVMGRVTADGALPQGGRGVLALAGSGRRRCAEIRADGYYYFLDVPSGRYKLVGRGITLRTIVIAPGQPRKPLPILKVDLVAAIKTATPPRKEARRKMPAAKSGRQVKQPT